jgi:hypothetical protein
MICELNWKFLNFQELSLDTAWWQIYEDSFPLSERDSKDNILKAVEKKLAIVGSYQLKNHTVAIVVFYCLQTSILSFVFLNYIAIGHSGRNRGLGGKLFSSLLLHIEKMNELGTHKYQAVVWEIEDPDMAVNNAEKQFRERRLNFYRRLGGKYFKHIFMQPPIDGSTILSMRLMYYSPDQIDIPDFESVMIEAIYFQKYHVVNGVDKKILNDLLKQIWSNNHAHL